MSTAFMLLAFYEGRPIVPLELVCRDFFSHLNPDKFARKVAAGEIQIPIIRMEASQKAAKGVHLSDLADIIDLHLHDLRHEGISRLFELGWNIPHAAAVSGHRSWQSLKRYTHLRHSGDKWAGWHWLPIVTAPESETAGHQVGADGRRGVRA